MNLTNGFKRALTAWPASFNQGSAEPAAELLSSAAATVAGAGIEQGVAAYLRIGIGQDVDRLRRQAGLAENHAESRLRQPTRVQRRKVSSVSEHMSACTLQWLQGDGLVQRRLTPVVPPHVEYWLTPLGREAAERVANLADWIETNLAELMVPSPSADKPPLDGPS